MDSSHRRPTASSLPPLNHRQLSEVPIDSESDSDSVKEFDVVEAKEAGPVTPVGHWTNAYQHSRAATGNVFTATTQFSRSMYHSGIGAATVATVKATASSVVAGAQITARHIFKRNRRNTTSALPDQAFEKPAEGPEDDEDDEENLIDLPLDLFSEESPSLETVPAAVLGADIDDPRPGQRLDMQRTQSTDRRKIVGPAQYRHPSRSADEPQMLIHHPNHIPQQTQKREVPGTRERIDSASHSRPRHTRGPSTHSLAADPALLEERGVESVMSREQFHSVQHAQRANSNVFEQPDKDYYEDTAARHLGDQRVYEEEQRARRKNLRREQDWYTGEEPNLPVFDPSQYTDDANLGGSLFDEAMYRQSREVAEVADIERRSSASAAIVDFYKSTKDSLFPEGKHS